MATDVITLQIKGECREREREREIYITLLIYHHLGKEKLDDDIANRENE